MQDKERSSIINKVAIISIVTNSLLSVLKLITGVFAYSQAMISDGVDSMADVLLTMIVILGVNIAKKSKDDNHQYGHEKIESFAAVLLSAILLATAVGIGAKGISSIRSILGGEITKSPKTIALFAAIISIGAKEILFRYAKNAAKKTKSTALMADAWNFRSDAIASIGSFIGIGGAMLGIKILDPIASILIALLIVRISVRIGITGMNEMTDHAADKDVQKKIYDTIATVRGVWFVDELKTRLHGSRLFVDVDIAVNGQISVKEAHSIADNVSEAVYSCDLDVKECMVHVNPYDEVE